MFPLVPYYRLPELHRICAHDFPAPNTSIGQALSEMLPALWRQRNDPDYHIRHALPKTANPYQESPAKTGGSMTYDKENTMNQWIDACAIDDIEEEDVIRFDHDSRTFIIVRDHEKQLLLLRRVVHA